MLKVTVGLVHVGLLATSLLGYLPLTCWTSAMVAYGSANAMVSLAEKNAHGTWGRREVRGVGEGVQGWDARHLSRTGIIVCRRLAAAALSA